jgi:hypothetical protein
LLTFKGASARAGRLGTALEIGGVATTVVADFFSSIKPTGCFFC